MTQSIPQTLPDSREAFEAWYASRHGKSMLARAANGPYVWDSVNDRWEAWQAALAAQPLAVAAIPEPSDAEVDLLLAEIDQIAQNYDHHDYGLPTCDDDSVASMRAQVQWFFESWTRAPQPPAVQQDRGEACPNCNGEGTVLVYSNHGPDSYEMAVDCPHCEGGQSLFAAYHGAVKRIAEAKEKYLKAGSIIWGWGNRDQVNAVKYRLTEIAKQIRPDTLDWLRDRLADLTESATDHLAASPPPAPPREPLTEEQEFPINWDAVPEPHPSQSYAPSVLKWHSFSNRCYVCQGPCVLRKPAIRALGPSTQGVDHGQG